MLRIKKIFFVLGLTALCAAMPCIAENIPDEQDVALDATLISEAFGHLIAHNLNTPGFEFNLSHVIKGMQDAANGIDSPLSEAEYEEAITTIQKNCFDELAAQNLHQANEFLEANANNPDVIELVAGKLQMSILQEGTGVDIVEHTSAPLVHYSGKYINGTIFSSSEEIGSPIPLQLDQAIPGFIQGLIGAKVGEIRRLFIHPDHAYGTSELLLPNSLLIFDIEIVELAHTTTMVNEPPTLQE